MLAGALQVEVDAYIAAFAAGLREAEPDAPAGDLPEAAELGDGAAAWVPRLGDRAPAGGASSRTRCRAAGI